MTSRALGAFEGRNALITGGLGFIGSNLARRLVELGARVVLVDFLAPKFGGNRFNIRGIEDRVTVNLCDVRDEHSMAALVQGQDFVFNLAGQVSHLDSMENPQRDLQMNGVAPLSVLEACRERDEPPVVVFASTRQIYGRPQYLPVDEDHPLRPVDVNGINKMAAEAYHLLYDRVYGVPSCSLRLTNTYGPGMWVRDARQTFLGDWIRRLLTGVPIEVWGGDQLRDFTYVGDAVEAFLLAAASKQAYGRVFNVGGDGPIRLDELARTMIELHGSGSYEIREFPCERMPVDIGSFHSDDTLIREELGWQVRTPLRDGLGETLRFYGANLGEYV